MIEERKISYKSEFFVLRGKNQAWPPLPWPYLYFELATDLATFGHRSCQIFRFGQGKETLNFLFLFIVKKLLKKILYEGLFYFY